MLENVWRFLKNPIYNETEYTTAQKSRAFIRLLVLTVLFSFAFGILMEIITSMLSLDIGDHAVIELIENYSPLVLFALAVIAAPLIEELIFRAPLGLFRRSKYFKYAYYISILLFGLIHITNFEDFQDNFWLIPILVAPQLSAGIFLGYIRVKLGLLWSILLHAAHNMVLLGPVIIMKLLDIPFE